ncbi:uncharacterized protein LOC135366644 [Ornithodoros turicata]|uniref:uncharacterized protein LOC135366644 n=1 Tax=Ornithodoros turicata TaxID=34597 RepID=UPI0031387C77
MAPEPRKGGLKKKEPKAKRKKKGKSDDGTQGDKDDSKEEKKSMKGKDDKDDKEENKEERKDKKKDKKDKDDKKEDNEVEKEDKKDGKKDKDDEENKEERKDKKKSKKGKDDKKEDNEVEKEDKKDGKKDKDDEENKEDKEDGKKDKEDKEEDKEDKKDGEKDKEDKEEDKEDKKDGKKDKGGKEEDKEDKKEGKKDKKAKKLKKYKAKSKRKLPEDLPGAPGGAGKRKKSDTKSSGGEDSNVEEKGESASNITVASAAADEVADAAGVGPKPKKKDGAPPVTEPSTAVGDLPTAPPTGPAQAEPDVTATTAASGTEQVPAGQALKDSEESAKSEPSAQPPTTPAVPSTVPPPAPPSKPSATAEPSTTTPKTGTEPLAESAKVTPARPPDTTADTVPQFSAQEPSLVTAPLEDQKQPAVATKSSKGFTIRIADALSSFGSLFMRKSTSEVSSSSVIKPQGKPQTAEVLQQPQAPDQPQHKPAEPQEVQQPKPQSTVSAPTVLEHTKTIRGIIKGTRPPTVVKEVEYEEVDYWTAGSTSDSDVVRPTTTVTSCSVEFYASPSKESSSEEQNHLWKSHGSVEQKFEQTIEKILAKYGLPTFRPSSEFSSDISDDFTGWGQNIALAPTEAFRPDAVARIEDPLDPYGKPLVTSDFIVSAASRRVRWAAAMAENLRVAAQAIQQVDLFQRDARGQRDRFATELLRRAALASKDARAASKAVVKAKEASKDRSRRRRLEGTFDSHPSLKAFAANANASFSTFQTNSSAESAGKSQTSKAIERLPSRQKALSGEQTLAGRPEKIPEGRELVAKAPTSQPCWGDALVQTTPGKRTVSAGSSKPSSDSVMGRETKFTFAVSDRETRGKSTTCVFFRPSRRLLQEQMQARSVDKGRKQTEECEVCGFAIETKPSFRIEHETPAGTESLAWCDRCNDLTRTHVAASSPMASTPSLATSAPQKKKRADEIPRASIEEKFYTAPEEVNGSDTLKSKKITSTIKPERTDAYTMASYFSDSVYSPGQRSYIPVSDNMPSAGPAATDIVANVALSSPMRGAQQTNALGDSRPRSPLSGGAIPGTQLSSNQYSTRAPLSPGDTVRVLDLLAEQGRDQGMILAAVPGTGAGVYSPVGMQGVVRYPLSAHAGERPPYLTRDSYGSVYFTANEELSPQGTVPVAALSPRTGVMPGAMLRQRLGVDSVVQSPRFQMMPALADSPTASMALAQQPYFSPGLAEAQDAGTAVLSSFPQGEEILIAAPLPAGRGFAAAATVRTPVHGNLPAAQLVPEQYMSPIANEQDDLIKRTGPQYVELVTADTPQAQLRDTQAKSQELRNVPALQAEEQEVSMPYAAKAPDTVVVVEEDISVAAAPAMAEERPSQPATPVLVQGQEPLMTPFDVQGPDQQAMSEVPLQQQTLSPQAAGPVQQITGAATTPDKNANEVEASWKELSTTVVLYPESAIVCLIAVVCGLWVIYQIINPPHYAENSTVARKAVQGINVHYRMDLPIAGIRTTYEDYDTEVHTHDFNATKNSRTSRKPTTPTMDLTCTTVLCHREARFLDGILRGDPCQNFYNYVCKKVVQERHPYTGVPISTDTIIVDNLEDRALKYLNQIAHEDVKLAREMLSECINSRPQDHADEATDIVRSYSPTGSWPLQEVSSPDIPWTMAGRVLRDLGIGALLTASLEQNPLASGEVVVSIDKPSLLYLDEDTDKILNKIYRAIEDVVPLVNPSANAAAVAEMIGDVVRLFARKFTQEFHYDPEPLPVADLHAGVKKVLITVFGSPLPPAVLVNTARFMGPLVKAVTTNPAAHTNYVGFLTLLFFAPYLGIPSLTEVFPLILTAPPADSQRLCSRLVERVMPMAYMRALAHEFTSVPFAHVWAMRVENKFFKALSRLKWLYAAGAHGDTVDAHLVKFKLKRIRVAHFFPLRTVHNASWAIYESRLRRELGRARGPLGRVLAAAKLRQRDGNITSIFDVKASYVARKKLLYIPVGIVNASVPANSTLFYFQTARFGVRAYRALLATLRADSAGTGDLAFSSAYKQRLRQIYGCLEEDYRNAPEQLKSGSATQPPGNLLLEQAVATMLAYRTFQELMDTTKNVLASDFKLPGLEQLSSDQLFFVYFALDNCERNDYSVTGRQSYVAASVRVNLPLRQWEQFGRIFRCRDGRDMVASDACPLIDP